MTWILETYKCTSKQQPAMIEENQWNSLEKSHYRRKESDKKLNYKYVEKVIKKLNYKYVEQL